MAGSKSTLPKVAGDGTQEINRQSAAGNASDKSATAPQGLLSRMKAKLNKVSRRTRLAILLGSGAVVANLVLVVAWLHFKPSHSDETGVRPDYIGKAWSALDRGAFFEAKRQALLARDSNLSEQEAGGPAFVLGAVAAMQADTMWEEDQRRYYLVASRYLAESESLGFPPDREAQGLLLLGKSLCLSRQFNAGARCLNAH